MTNSFSGTDGNSSGKESKSGIWDPSGIKASVVIPCFNNAMHTRLCLKNLYDNTDPQVYEIIIVDDASTDATSALTSTADDWIRIVRNPENLGFGPSCNKGAQLARSDIIVFLNNDAFVLPNWLQPLLDCFNEDEQLGAVQPKLLYPNGTVNDAGGLVFAEGKAWNYGKGQNIIDAPLINTRRRPDYVSGACLAVRKEAFYSVGGFDPRYAPAYYEDTDLSFALAKTGWKLLYEPKSTVVHLEGATAGNDLEKGVKRFQIRNEIKFKEKWADELELRPHLDPVIVDRWAFRPGKGFVGVGNYHTDGQARTILVIDVYPPMFDRASGGKRMFELLKRLRELGHSVSFLSNTGIGPKYAEQLSKYGIPSFGGNPNHPQFSDQIYRSTHRPAIQQLLVAGGYDTVIISPWIMGESLIQDIRGSAPHAKIILDTCDVHFIRLEREAALLGTAAEEVENLKARELAVYAQCDAVVCITDTDREILAKYLGDQKLYTVPNCHDLEDQGPDFDERNGLLFVGNFVHPPNIDSVRWWKSEVMGRLRPGFPNHVLTVVGNDPGGLASAESAPGLEVMGTVDSLHPYYHRAKVAIAPLRYGAGMKGKVGEALSFGTPLVASPIAVEGMNLIHRKNVLIADTPNEFVVAVNELISNKSLWLGLREAGRAFVEREIGPSRMRRLVDELIKGVWRQ